MLRTHHVCELRSCIGLVPTVVVGEGDIAL